MKLFECHKDEMFHMFEIEFTEEHGESDIAMIKLSIIMSCLTMKRMSPLGTH